MDIQRSRAIIGQGDSCKAIFCTLLADVWPYLVHLVGREKENTGIQWLDTATVRPSSCLKKMNIEETSGRKLAGFNCDKHLEQGWGLNRSWSVPGWLRSPRNSVSSSLSLDQALKLHLINDSIVRGYITKINIRVKLSNPAFKKTTITR